MKKFLSVFLACSLSLSVFTALPAEELVSEEVVPESYVYQVPEMDTDSFELPVVEVLAVSEDLSDGFDEANNEEALSGEDDVESDSSSLPVVSASNETTITGYYNSIKGADLRWKKVDGATGYVIYRRRQAEGTVEVARIDDPNTVQYYDTSISENCWGRVYVYYICPLFGTEVGISSNEVTLQRLAPMKITQASGTTDGKISLKWACTNSSNKAEGYEIHIASSWPDLSNRNGTFEAITVTRRNSLSKTLTGLTVGKTYHIRIRSYVYYTHSVTGKTTKTWSQFSDVVRVKVPVATPTPTPSPKPTATPTIAPQASTYQYVLNKNSGVFHYSWCASVKRMSVRNRVYFTGTRNQVVAMGYRACHNCKP